MDGKTSSIVSRPSRRLPTSTRWNNAVWMCIGAAVTWLAMRPTNNYKAILLGNKIESAVQHEDSAFGWDKIPSYPHLSYTNCFGSYQCARLKVPMDPFNGTTNATVDLAIVRQPASVPVTDPRYGGIILVNPGGPGGSGVEFILGYGPLLQETINSNSTTGKQFDIVSFDPRGIGQTLPRVQCFDDPAVDQSFMLRFNEEGMFESSNAAFGRMWAMMSAKGQTCTQARNPNFDVDDKKYVSTSYVAHDMLEIVERHGEWREQEALKLLRRKTGRLAAAVVPCSLKYNPGHEKIQYWGFSYGSYLGNTFAAMYPDRIQRLVVDGVVDADNYRAALWSNNLIDAEKTMDQFYYHCARVGYPSCMLAKENGTSTSQDIKDRVHHIIQGLLHHPLPVVGSNPEVVTYSDLRRLVFASLYSPMLTYPAVAVLLAEIEAGNGTIFANALIYAHAFNCKIEHRPLADGLMAIACSDGDSQTNVSAHDFRQHIKDLSEISPTMGSMWAQIRMQCVHYGVRPEFRFVGPWKAKTSHPLLMIGNTADPVTPAAYAHKMAAGFEGAVALIQDSPGHCSIAAFSNCTVQYIKQYFQTGELPPPNTTCTADELPFGPGSNETLLAQSREFEHARQRHGKIMSGLEKSGGLLMRHLHARGLP